MIFNLKSLQNIFAQKTHTHNEYLTSHQDITGKVDKVEGKGLSTNDFTDSYKNSIDNLGTTIANAVGDIDIFELLGSNEELPSSNIKDNCFYLKPNTVNGTTNKYDVYLRVGNDWEKIDSLDFNISDYLRTSDASTSAISNSETYSNIGSNLTNQKLINDAINTKFGTIMNSSGEVDLTGKVNITNGASQMTDSNANTYTNIGSNLSTQASINSAINTTLGNILTIINGTGEE